MRFNWKKTLLLMCDIALGVYLIAAFTAFNKPDETAYVCSKVNIDIQDEATNGFITAPEIKARLEKQHLYPMSKPLEKVNTREIEDVLKQSSFVKTAECYKIRLSLVGSEMCIRDRYYLHRSASRNKIYQ